MTARKPCRPGCRCPRDPAPRACWCGAAMLPAGHGAFPYPCERWAAHPRAMVYRGCAAGHNCWTVDLDDNGETTT